MKISVLIPAYNCAATLRATIDSVMAQTRPADEILVMDDGSVDGTNKIAKSYEPKVTVFWQPNGGAAHTRNELIARASGDLITFIDSDDIWHERYLEAQCQLFEGFPNAVAFFAGHVNFSEGETPLWDEIRLPLAACKSAELIPPVEFFRRYNTETGPFACFTYCALPMDAFKKLGGEPFKGPPTEDSYCCSLLSLLGPVVKCSIPLAAYRVRSGSISANHLHAFGVWVKMFEILHERFKLAASPIHLRVFRTAWAAKRRCYAKLLMSAGDRGEARRQLRHSLGNSFVPMSLGKSLAMLAVTYLPPNLQPRWRSSYR